MRDYISDIISSRSLDEIKPAISALIDYLGENNDNAEQLCEQLKKAVIKMGQPYMERPLASERNVVIIPPEVSPVLMIPTCVPISDSPEMILAAQRRFRYIEIVAFFMPLKIVRLNNSHETFNCECGIPDGHSRQAMIFVYHPNQLDTYDRVFIFAHELGHALHLSWTGNVSITPDKFDLFNESLGIKDMPIVAKQEHFANAVAIAILGDDMLKGHLPDGLPEQALPHFEEYVRLLTSQYIKKYEGTFFYNGLG